VKDPFTYAQKIDPALMVQMLVYNLDTLHHEELASAIRIQISYWLQNDPSMQSYLIRTIRHGLTDRRRFDAEYQNVLRVLVAAPEYARQAVPVILEGLEQTERRWLEADAINATADNQFNRIISSHAELSRHEGMGLGLIPLGSKLSDPLLTTPYSTLDLQEELTACGFDLTVAMVESRLDPFRFASWHGMVIPRLSILQSGYRGARAFDDPTARYITRAIPVALTYSWKGGERAEGEGERVVHEWSFPSISEQVADLKVGEEADITLGELNYFDVKRENVRSGSPIRGTVRIQSDTQGIYVLGIRHGKLALVRIVYDLVNVKVTASLLAEYEMPVEGEFRLVTLPPAFPGERPMVFQVGRRGVNLYMLMVDRNVALANHLMQAPGREAYVRKVSTEGRADLDTVRVMGRMQLAERQLREELLDAVQRLHSSQDAAEALWALRTMQSALSDLDPETPVSDPQAVPVQFEMPYFQSMYGELKTLLTSLGTEAELMQMLSQTAARRRLSKSIERSLRRLTEQRDLLQGTIEAPEWEFAVDPYRGEVHNRRTLANHFIEMLRRHPQPSVMIRQLFRRSDLSYFLKEFTRLEGVAQSIRFHGSVTADEHTLRVIEEMDKVIANNSRTPHPEELRLLALFHDVGKSEGSPGHAARSVEAMESFLRSAGTPEPIIRRLGMLIQIHQMLGMITASDVRRLASGRKAELDDPGYRAAKQSRIETLAGILSEGYSLQQALVNLEDLCRLTIADSSAIPFPEGDTGNRYTTLFARELRKVKILTAVAIRQHFLPSASFVKPVILSAA